MVKLSSIASPRAMRSLSRLRGEAWGVSPQSRLPMRSEPPPGTSRRPSPQAGEVERNRRRRVLRGPDFGEEAVDLAGEIARLRRELLGCAQHLVGGRSRVVGGAPHAGDVGIDFLSTAGGLLHAARDLLGRRT